METAGKAIMHHDDTVRNTSPSRIATACHLPALVGRWEGAPDTYRQRLISMRLHHSQQLCSYLAHKLSDIKHNEPKGTGGDQVMTRATTITRELLSTRQDLEV